MFKETLLLSNANLEAYLNTISFPKLTKEKSEILDGGITEKEQFIALESMENTKSPGNYGLMKEFHITFWNEVRIPLLLAIEKGYLVKHLSVSQKTSSNKINRKERTRQKIYSKMVTYFLI